MFSISTTQWTLWKRLGGTTECPNCHKRHRVHTETGKDGLLSHISTVRCTKDGASYMVGFNGRAIPMSNYKKK